MAHRGRAFLAAIGTFSVVNHPTVANAICLARRRKLVVGQSRQCCN